MDNSTMFVSCILAVGIGLIPAAIAKNKGHDFATWWLFGAAIFIIALPLALMLKENTAKVEQSQLASGESKKCPYCAELIKREAKVCKHCGRDIL
ncbi:MAG: zinc ribbon domain-containing protein [Chloroflexota bacterium]